MEEVHILAYCFSLLGQLDACDGNAKRRGGRVGGESKLRCSEKKVKLFRTFRVGMVCKAHNESIFIPRHKCICKFYCPFFIGILLNIDIYSRDCYMLECQFA